MAHESHGNAAIRVALHHSERGMKQSRPEKVGDTWRIRRHDGELVGYYATRELAQRAIDIQPWLK